MKIQCAIGPSLKLTRQKGTLGMETLASDALGEQGLFDLGIYKYYLYFLFLHEKNKKTKMIVHSKEIKVNVSQTCSIIVLCFFFSLLCIITKWMKKKIQGFRSFFDSS